MGITIKKAKAIVKGITDKIDCNTVDIDDWAEFWGFTREEYEEFLDMSIKAISTMRKYQKIEEIINSKTTRLSYEVGFRQIRKVVEDGKDD